MASKASITSWGGIKTTFARTKQAAAVKLGRASKTEDVAFNQEFTRMVQEEKTLKKIHEHLKKFIKTIKEMCLAHAQVSDDIFRLYEPGRELHALAQYNQSVAGEIDVARSKFEEECELGVLKPVKDQLGQFTLLHKRVDERNRRVTDMDRYHREVTHMREKPPKNPAKLTVAEEKYERTRIGYDGLNEELIQDMPRLVEDRFDMFDPCFANLTRALHEFYQECTRSMSETLIYIQNIDGEKAFDHPPVVTQDSVANYPPGHMPDGTMSAAGGVLKEGQTSGNPYDNDEPSDHNPYAESAAARRAPPPRPTPAAAALPPGQPGLPQARALYPFQAADASELSFNFGDVLSIHRQDGEWWEAELNGNRGVIPANYVQLL